MDRVPAHFSGLFQPAPTYLSGYVGASFLCRFPRTIFPGQYVILREIVTDAMAGSLRKSLISTVAITSLFAGSTRAADLPPQTKRPTIGLVLNGGGALGLAHIGVLRWLEEHRIPVDIVAGTSMGGLVGGVYATGKSPEQAWASRRGRSGGRCRALQALL